ncbi:MAG: hypothetical protein EA368_16840 [Leptolyngbya sp. DLM2.Bin27]|nr:MAG: hypothetical protein EA368_16840 [Leptolyngbya sp. DLM2.Bin27]
MTGGLLGLAGLGLLPQGAEAATDLPPVVPDPGLGAALAENPSPVIAPEPSAQTTEPQVDQPPPAWTPESEQSVAIAAAAVAPPPEAEGNAAIAAPESPALAEALPPEAAPAMSASAEEPVVADPNPGATVAPDQLQAAIATPVGSAVEPASKPERAKPPALALEVSIVEVPTAGTPAPAAVALEAVAPAAAPRITAAPLAASPPAAPSPAPWAAAAQPAPLAPAAVARDHTVAPDLATLQARAAMAQALMQDIRAAAGLAESATVATPSPSSQVSQPESWRREPQLPPLPSRSGRRRPAVGQPVAHQAPASASPQAAPPSLRPGPQLPNLSKPTRSTHVALALPTAQPTMSPGRVDWVAPELSPAPALNPAAQPAVSQVEVTPVAQTPADADQLRRQLQVAPLTTAAAPMRTFPPSPSAGIPSAFGANWGDTFISASLSGADRERPEADGSLSAGFGLGDSRRAVGVELNYNLLSIRRFGENGGFDAKVHREIYSGDATEVAAAVGLNNVVSYGPQAGGSRSSLYGVVTAAHLLQPEHPVNRLPITSTVGLGGGTFAGENSDVGLLAGVGLQVHPQFSINTAWSGVGVNVGASIVPVTTVPLTLNLLYGDIGNNTRAGSVAVLSIGYGFNFGPRF